MEGLETSRPARPRSWPDERLVRACRKGDPQAWDALIEKYKNLIFSVPIKFGLSRDEAGDVFQAVCVEVLAKLEQLREPKALPKWLMQISYRQCLRWKQDRLDLLGSTRELEEQMEPSSEELPEAFFIQLQREQNVRDAMAALPERCREMVRMLFFEDPPRPYEEVAKQLQLAPGSIGFIRGRCLKKLRQLLQERGFE